MVWFKINLPIHEPSSCVIFIVDVGSFSLAKMIDENRKVHPITNWWVDIKQMHID